VQVWPFITLPFVGCDAWQNGKIRRANDLVRHAMRAITARGSDSIFSGELFPVFRLDLSVQLVASAGFLHRRSS
jgi:hypothetical protein